MTKVRVERGQMVDLLVMRLNEMVRVHPDMDRSQVCSRCRAPVGIYPSGQAIIAQLGRDKVNVVCSHCRPVGPDDKLAPGAEIEPFESVRNPEGPH